MFCTKCGHQVADEALFCQQCGNKLPKIENVRPVQQTAPAKPVAPVQPAAPVQQTAPVQPVAPAQNTQQMPSRELIDQRVSEENAAIAADKSKKARISMKLLKISMVVAVISFVLYMITNSMVFVVCVAAAFWVGIFAFIAFVGYMKDIPKEYRTKGQKRFLGITSFLYVALVIFFFWYRFLDGQSVIFALIRNAVT